MYAIQDRATGEVLPQRYADRAEAEDQKRILCEQSSWIRYKVIEWEEER